MTTDNAQGAAQEPQADGGEGGQPDPEGAVEPQGPSAEVDDVPADSSLDNHEISAQVADSEPELTDIMLGQDQTEVTTLEHLIESTEQPPEPDSPAEASDNE